MALKKFSVREIRNRPGRAVLTLLSVVIGVAAIVSVSAGTSTTRRAFKEMFATLSGRTSLEVTSSGGASFDQGILADIEKLPGVEAAVPLLRPSAMLYTADDRKVQLTLLGIDEKKDTAIRQYELVESKEFPSDNVVLMDYNFAEGLGLKVGDKVTLLASGTRLKNVIITGLVKPKGVSAAGQGVVYMNITLAQEQLLGRPYVDAIQIVAKDDANVDKLARQVEALLPPGLIAQKPQSPSAEETLVSTEQALTLATYFSWVLGFLVVLNTFQMNVVERRRQLSILRAIGATRGQIMSLVCREALWMGGLGTLLGVGVGIGGAALLSRATTQVLQMTLPPLQIGWLTIALAVIVGPAVSLLGALWPAWRASRLSPLEGMGAILPADLEAPPWTLAALGSLVVASGAVLVAASFTGHVPLNISVIGALTILFGLVLVIPIALGPLTRSFAWLLSPLLGVEGRLAEGQIVRRRGRTTLTVGVLFLALAFGIGMANMIVDSVNDVKKWYRDTIQADYFVRVMMPTMSTGVAAVMPPDLVEKIGKVPHIANMQRVRFTDAKAAGKQIMLVVGEFSGDHRRRFNLIEGDPEELPHHMKSGGVVVGGVLAHRTGLKLNDQIPMETAEGTKKFRIAGITNEYMAGGMTMYMERGVAERLFDITGTSGVAITVVPGHLRDVGESLQALSREYGMLLQSQQDLINMIDKMVAGLVGCLWFLLAIVLAISAFGVVNTLTMNVIEQTRELGLLRIVAMTRGQVRKMILAQAALLAAIGLSPGVLAGLKVTWLMNLSMKPATGRAVELVWHPWMIAGYLVAAFFMVLIAAWFPARRAATIDLPTALQYQ